MTNPAQYGSLKFEEAVDFFKDKIPLPTETWSDITDAAHNQSFVIAGGIKAELLSDFHESILKAIEDGSDITEFRKDFDQIVEKHGWSYKGKRGWRTAIILDTNLSTAYAAGRDKQRRTPEIIKVFPNNEYFTINDSDVRKKHKDWHGIILPWNDPFWDTHTPPNGWHCRCWITPTNKNSDTSAPEINTVPWENPSTGKTQQVPEGIDPGFAYNPGQSAVEASVISTVQNVKQTPEPIQLDFFKEMEETTEISDDNKKIINKGK